MGSLRLVAWGLVLVIADFRINGLDVVPDPVGWLLVVIGLALAAEHHSGFRVAMVAAGIAGLASLTDVLQPMPDWADTLTVATMTIVVFATCTAIMVLLSERARMANRIRWADLGLTLVGAAVGLAVEGSYFSLGDAGTAFLVIVLALAGLGVVIWFVVVLFRCAGDPLPSSAQQS